MTAPVTVPAMSDTPPFPALSDRAAGTYNSKAYDFGTHMSDVFNAELVAVANSARTNALSAEESATAAAGSAGTASTKATEASGSASAAAGSAGTANTKASEASISAAAAAASAASAAAIAGAFVGTSTSSLTIGSGNKTFVTQAGEQYTAGVFMTAVSAANNSNYMFGQVVSYSGTNLVLNVSMTGGSGTYADWNLSLAGPQGATGPQGPAGPAFTGGNLTSAVNEARATVASHATTGAIWSALGNQIDWTGTATTTAFPNAPQAGAERTLICAAACSFTAGANMLIDGVNNGSTVTCAANDKVVVRAISTTQFMLSRIKYDGTPQVSSAAQLPRSPRTSNIALAASDSGTQIDVTSGSFTQTSASAATLGAGWHVQYKVTGTGTITLGFTVDGIASGTVTPGMVLQITCDGSAFSATRLGAATTMQILTSGTAWVGPIGVRRAKLRGCGGGGSGATTGAAQPGGAGSGAGYFEKWINVAPGTSYTYAIGAPGASRNGSGGAGNSGGATTFNDGATTYTANGGTGGSLSTAVSGGTAANGDINIAGGEGMIFSSQGTSRSGSTPLGMGASLPGSVGTGYGAGSAGNANAASAAGLPGAIILEY